MSALVEATSTCDYPQCEGIVIAVVVDMENNWWSWCHEHAVIDLTGQRERGA